MLLQGGSVSCCQVLIALPKESMWTMKMSLSATWTKRDSEVFEIKKRSDGVIHSKDIFKRNVKVTIQGKTTEDRVEST